MRRTHISTRLFTQRCVNRVSERDVDRNRRSTIWRGNVAGPDRETIVACFFAWRQESRLGECGCALRDQRLEFADRSDACFERLVQGSEFDLLFTRWATACGSGQRPFKSSDQAVGSRDWNIARARTIDAADHVSRVAS